MNRLIFSTIVSFLCWALSGQTATTDYLQDAEPVDYNKGLRVSISHFLDPTTPAVVVGYERKVSDRSYLRHEGAIYFRYGFSTEPQGLLGLSGFGVRTAFRRIKPYRFGNSRRERSYIETSLDYRYYDVDVAGDFSRNGFSQRINYAVWQHSLGINLIFGQVLYFGSKLRLDISVGIGGYVAFQRFSEVPEDARFRTNEDVAVWDHSPDGRVTGRPRIPLGLSLVYVL
ncbi:MAG: hypothetical protein AAF741_11785 [Bacteroidota bacterium]